MSIPSELSKRALLERIFDIVERTEYLVTAAAEYIKTALDDLDVQMENLKTRLQDDAANLAAALAQAQIGAEDEQVLTDAAARIQATASAVSQLAPPSAVADPDQPDVGADPVTPDQPTEPTDPTDPTEPTDPATV